MKERYFIEAGFFQILGALGGGGWKSEPPVLVKEIPAWPKHKRGLPGDKWAEYVEIDGMKLRTHGSSHSHLRHDEDESGPLINCIECPLSSKEEYEQLLKLGWRTWEETVST